MQSLLGLYILRLDNEVKGFTMFEMNRNSSVGFVMLLKDKPLVCACTNTHLCVVQGLAAGELYLVCKRSHNFPPPTRMKGSAPLFPLREVTQGSAGPSCDTL